MGAFDGLVPRSYLETYFDDHESPKPKRKRSKKKVKSKITAVCACGQSPGSESHAEWCDRLFIVNKDK